MEEENRFRSWACSWGVKDIIKVQAFITHSLLSTHTHTHTQQQLLRGQITLVYVHFSPYRVKAGARFKKWYNSVSIHLFTSHANLNFSHYIHLSVKPLCTCHVKYQHIHSCLFTLIFHSSPDPSIHLHTTVLCVWGEYNNLSLFLSPTRAHTHTNTHVQPDNHTKLAQQRWICVSAAVLVGGVLTRCRLSQMCWLRACLKHFAYFCAIT